MKDEKYYRQLFKKQHDCFIGDGENIQNAMTEDRFINVIKQLKLCGVGLRSEQLPMCHCRTGKECVNPSSCQAFGCNKQM